MDVPLSVLAAGVAATSAPLVFAALGETLTEKAGVINLSLDGTILLAAMTGFAAASVTGSVWPGFAAAMATGAAVSLILALIGVWLGQSQVAVGFALTFLCRDLAYFLGTPFSRTPGPQQLSQPVPLLSDLPLIGSVLFNHPLIVYGSFLLIPLLFYFMFHSRQGLILRAVGENPEGCWARGIRPRLTQTIYVVAGGALVGLAGAAYSLAIKPGWGRPQGCEGIGWIALALVIFGGWHPLRVALGAYIFGMLQMAGIVLQNIFPTIPSQIFQVAPFPLMIFTLVIIHLSRGSRAAGNSRILTLLSGTPPAALGRTHEQD
jgi:simple sugar transport system permease protein